jgi:hypothetical protein
LNDTFGHRIDMTVDFGAKSVEHLVYSDELDSFEVPMCLLREQSEIDTVGEARIQNIDRDGFRVRFQIILSFVEFRIAFGFRHGRGFQLGRTKDLRDQNIKFVRQR